MMSVRGVMEIEGGDDLTCEIEIGSQSPWRALLGDMPLPVFGSIEKLDQRLAGHRVPRVVLTGEPGACLLVMLWVRSIWGGADTTVELVWPVGELESQPAQRQSASRLACLLADRVQCDAPERVWDAWGFDPREPGIAEEAFDLLVNLVDLWDPDLHLAYLAEDWTQAMQRALNRCAEAGHRKIGIYGAGTHTRGVGGALMQAPVEICCIIDDDARRRGERLGGFEIVSPQRANELGLDAVVLSANSVEDRLWERAAVLREQGIETVRLYGHDAPLAAGGGAR